MKIFLQKAPLRNLPEAPLPLQIIEKGIAIPGLAIYCITAKFCNAKSFYRLSNIFKRADIDLPRATRCRWPIMIHTRHTDFFDLMREELLSYPVIGIDETTVRVMDEPGRMNTDKLYMWVFRGHGKDYPTIVFYYHTGRPARTAQEHFKDYKGFIQTDGLSTYDAELGKNDAVHMGCWAHVLRKFYDAEKNTEAKSNAHTALSFTGRLYDIEGEARDNNLTSEETWKFREKEARPVIESFQNRLKNKVHQRKRLAVMSHTGTSGICLNACLRRKIWMSCVSYCGNILNLQKLAKTVDLRFT